MSVWTLKCKESLLVLGDEQFNTLLCCHDPRIAQSYSNDTAESITPYPLYPTQKLHPPVFSLLFFHHFALFHFPSFSPLIGFDNALSLSCTPLLPWEKWSSCFDPAIPGMPVWNPVWTERLLLPKGHTNEWSKPVKGLKLHYILVNHKINCIFNIYSMLYICLPKCFVQE